MSSVSSNKSIVSVSRQNKLETCTTWRVCCWNYILEFQEDCICVFLGSALSIFLKQEIPERKPCDEESDWDGEEDHVCFSLFRNQARQRHSIALQPDVCQPFVIWPQFVICCLWFCNTIIICNLWFCGLYCNKNSLLTFRYRRIRMYMVLIMTTGTRNWKNIENTVYLLKIYIVETCCKHLELRICF